MWLHLLHLEARRLFKQLLLLFKKTYHQFHSKVKIHTRNLSYLFPSVELLSRHSQQTLPLLNKHVEVKDL